MVTIYSTTRQYIQQALIAVIILLTTPYIVAAQTEPSTFGTEFYVYFPNLPVLRGDTISTNLAIHIASREGKPDSVTIETFFPTYRRNVYYSDGSGLTTIYPDSSILGSRRGQVEAKVLRITTGSVSAVYAETGRTFSMDAYLVFAREGLGKEYMVASLGQRANPLFNPETFFFSGASIFAIEDSTEVVIVSERAHINQPGTFVSTPRGDTIRITLQKNQAQHLSINPRFTEDITGTHISANKVIGVLGYHNGATPRDTTYNGFLTSVDLLIEQLPPIEQLSKRSFVVPHQRAERQGGTQGAKSGGATGVRIVSPFDSTTVEVAGMADTLLRRGEFLDLRITTASAVVATKPILTVQFDPSSVYYQDSVGDPFMVYMPPPEQFLRSYTFISSPTPRFTEHYITICIPNSALPSIELDGIQLDISNARPVAGADYSVLTVAVQRGWHTISADEPFGLLVYGYARFESYGYTGASGTRRLLERMLDSLAPVRFSAEEGCSTTIIWREQATLASGIENISILEANNVQYTTPVVTATEARAVFTITDPNKDGYCVLAIRDSAANILLDTVWIAGFTLDLSQAEFTSVRTTLSQCDSILISNNGAFTQRFSVYARNNMAISVPPSYSVVELAPGEERYIPICFALSVGNRQVSDDIIFSNDCNNRAEFPITVMVQGLSTLVGTSRCEVPIRVTTEKILKQRGTTLAIQTAGTLILFDALGRELYRTNSTTTEWTVSLPTTIRGAVLYQFQSDSELLEHGALFVEE